MAVDSELRALGWATSDLLVAAVGLFVLSYPGIAVGNALVGAPLSDGTVNVAVGAFAVGGSYPFVAGDWSYAVLEDLVFAFVGTTLAGGVVGMGVIVGLGLDVSGSNRAPQAIVIALAYAAAYWIVVRR